MPKKAALTKVSAKPARGVAPLLADVRGLILAAREGIARTVNAGLTLLYWEIGSRIRRDVLNEKRAEYGEQIVSTLSAQLEEEFGRGLPSGICSTWSDSPRYFRIGRLCTH